MALNLRVMVLPGLVLWLGVLPLAATLSLRDNGV